MPNIHTFTMPVSAPEIRSLCEYTPDGTRKLLAPAISAQMVTITIDLDKLALDLGPRAIRSKSGRSVEAGGAIVVKR